MESNRLVIDVKNLRRSFGSTIAVYDFSLKAKQGEIIGFLGPNGSGKTTTIRMLCGLLEPDSGEGTCIGLDLKKDGEQIRSQVGYMTQRFSLYIYLTIYQNLVFIAKAVDVVNIKERVAEVIKKFGLEKRQHQKAGSLSGGWKQRLALAASVLHHPKLLLLDEPTAGVDPQARHEFWQIINDLATEGITILVSTHYMDEADRCNSIVYLAYGKVITQGTVKEIIQKAQLSTWQVSGKNINALANKLKKIEGVDQIIQLGSRLHVFGQDRATLVNNLRSYMLNLDYSWKGIDPSLDDVFIELIAKVKDERFD